MKKKTAVAVSILSFTGGWYAYRVRHEVLDRVVEPIVDYVIDKLVGVDGEDDLVPDYAAGRQGKVSPTTARGRRILGDIEASILKAAHATPVKPDDDVR